MMLTNATNYVRELRLIVQVLEKKKHHLDLIIEINR